MKISRDTLVLVFIRFSENLGYAITIPVIPFIAKNLGISDFLIGTIFALYSVSQLVGSPILGFVSDIIGRKKILILSQIGTTVGFVVLGLSHSYAPIVVSRVVDGITGGNASLVDSVVTDTYEKKDREKVFGLLSAASGAGILIGPGIGGLLASKSIILLISLSSFISFLTLTATVLFLSESHQPMIKTNKRTSKKNFKGLFITTLHIFDSKELNTVFIGKFLHEVILNALIVTLPIILLHLLGYNELNSGLMISLYFFFAFIYQITFLQKTLALKTHVVSLALGFGLWSLGLTAALLFNSLFGIIVLGILFMSGVAILQPLFTIIISSKAPVSHNGLTFGISQLLSSLAQLIGPLIGYTILQYGSVSGFLAVLLILSVLTLIYLFSKSQDLNNEYE